MKVNKWILDGVEPDTKLGRIITCALYLNTKKNECSGTIHEQVALEVIRGNSVIETIAKVTHFTDEIVLSALRNIAYYCALGKKAKA